MCRMRRMALGRWAIMHPPRRDFFSSSAGGACIAESFSSFNALSLNKTVHMNESYNQEAEVYALVIINCRLERLESLAHTHRCTTACHQWHDAATNEILKKRTCIQSSWNSLGQY
jgi:hypothetical protein